MPVLIIVDHEGTHSRVELEAGRSYVVGRSPRADIVLADPALSRRHAELRPDGPGWSVADLGSVNGVRVDGRRVEDPVPLEARVQVRLGDCHLRLRPDGERQSSQMSLVEGSPSRVSVRLDGDSAAGRSPTDPGDAGRDAAERRRVEVIERANLELLAHLLLERLLPRILDLVFEAVRPDRAALLLQGDDGDLQPHAFRGPGDAEVAIPRAVARSVLEERASLLTADAQVDARLDRSHSIGAQGVRAAMAVPLWNNREVIGLISADSLGGAGRFTDEDLRLLTMLGNIAAIQIENHRLFERQVASERIEREARAAAEIQGYLLPEGAPEIPGYQVAGFNAPCHEVGGDYFDFLRLDDRRHLVVVADVAGKGMGAALVMAVLQATLHAVAEEGAELLALVGRINRAIGRSTPANRIVTAFFLEIDHAAGRLRYVNAGHSPSPYLVPVSGETTRLPTGGPPLGPRPEFPYRPGELELGPGDLLFACSDGVPETVEHGNVLFGEERLVALLERSRSLPPAELHEAIRDELRSYRDTAPDADDRTMVSIRRSR